jgi:3',5'-cyclic AMP phosphodiesterase CpdA
MSAQSVKFLIFADFHYKKRMYASTISDLNRILKRAADENVDFVIHAGDFCNEYVISPEVKEAYLHNKYGLKVYGICGNHELEHMNMPHEEPLDGEHPMQYFAPFLTNDINGVVWGTADGKPAAHWEIAYYHFDRKGIRFVCADTQYSYSEARGAWEHNPDLNAPKGNICTESLGPVQRVWLESVLTDAARRNIPCVVFSHSAFAKGWANSHEHAAARELFGRINAIRKGTVIAAVNGHRHSDNDAEMIDGVLYLDINSALNGWWQRESEAHYGPEHTFDFEDYDKDGNYLGTKKLSYGALSMGGQTWFFRDPLSAVVTVAEDGRVTVDGMETEWAYGIAPPAETAGTLYFVRPRITSGTYKAER